MTATGLEYMLPQKHNYGRTQPSALPRAQKQNTGTPGKHFDSSDDRTTITLL